MTRLGWASVRGMSPEQSGRFCSGADGHPITSPFIERPVASARSTGVRSWDESRSPHSPSSARPGCWLRLPGIPHRSLYGHHGANFSAAQAASLIGKNSDIQNPTCDTKDTNGWDYACTYTYSQDGTLLRMVSRRTGSRLDQFRSVSRSLRDDRSRERSRVDGRPAFGDGPGGGYAEVGEDGKLVSDTAGAALGIANGIADLGPREMSLWLLSEMPG